MDLNKETVESVARVFNTIKENEGDSDHISIINAALERLWVVYDKPSINVNTNNVTKEDVKSTVDFLNEYAPSQNEMYKYRANNDGERHPNQAFNRMIDTVDLSSRYANRCLPSYRDWNVEYINNGEIIEKRVYDYDDEIPTKPTIDGVRYKCDSTKRGDGDVTVYVSKHPIREDIDIVINAEGDDFINLESHDGPNVKNDKEPIKTLGSEFNWGMLGETKIIINDKPENVIEFIDAQGWEYEYS